jgi:hypothetical protein
MQFNISYLTSHFTRVKTNSRVYSLQGNQKLNQNGINSKKL